MEIVVINLDTDICRKIRDARREAGISQSALSLEVGCKQSALSMFEQGDGTKLNETVVNALCKKFGIEIGNKPAVSVADNPLPALSTERGFCPNPSCPSHERYEIEGRLYLKPDREKQDPVYGKFCAVCGEVLEKKCPSCGRKLHEGACCSYCGQKYVSVPEG